MLRVIYQCLCFLLSVAGGIGVAHAYDNRLDPNVALRADIRVDLSREPRRTLDANAEGQLSSDKPRLPKGYASAMTWYRVALTEGYTQPPIVAATWPYDDQLPEPLHWAWVAESGDLVTRVGKGIFRLSFANSRSNWFRDVDCKLVSWPGGDTEAPMTCNDGMQRKLRIPGHGVVLVDDVQYTRVFHSEMTVLPPEETVEEIMARQDLAATTAAVAGESGGAEPAAEEPAPAPAKVPIPQPRPDNP